MDLRRNVVLRVSLMASLLAAGCASTRGGERSRSDLLTREEIMGVQGATNLYDVVQRLRPRWLRPRAQERSFSMETGIVVYQDQAYLGNESALRQFGPSAAYQLRYLDGPTASATLTGLPAQFVAAAIIISTRPQAP